MAAAKREIDKDSDGDFEDYDILGMLAQKEESKKHQSIAKSNPFLDKIESH